MPIQKVRIIGKYGSFRVGEVFAPASATFRNQLLKLKVAELVSEKSVEAEKRGRGRPRKNPEQ